MMDNIFPGKGYIVNTDDGPEYTREYPDVEFVNSVERNATEMEDTMSELANRLYSALDKAAIFAERAGRDHDGKIITCALVGEDLARTVTDPLAEQIRALTRAALNRSNKRPKDLTDD